MSELQRRTARTSRISGGALGIVVGIVLLFKGDLAAYLPLVGVAFIVAGAAVILLALRYARRP